MFSTSFLNRRRQSQTISGRLYWNPSSMMVGVLIPRVLNPAARKTINTLTTSQNTSSWNPVKTELLCVSSRSSLAAKYCEVSKPQIIPVEMMQRWIYQTLRRASITTSHLILNLQKQKPPLENWDYLFIFPCSQALFFSTGHPKIERKKTRWQGLFEINRISVFA